MNKLTDHCGFTLLEVMIAMFVTAIGLLGLAKMQSLAISSTQNAGSRSMIAFQVGSLVSAMHANKSYWGYGGAPATFSAKGLVVTDNSGELNASASASGACLSASCTPVQLAALDMQAWAASMNGRFPTYNARFNCTTDITAPIGCEIFVSWTENRVAISKATSGGADTQVQSYSVYAKP
ncbi:type IV pilus modification protein PilV [Actimicrobium sp. CCI2.3]|uniref:type IV pilus modification protein PilV n=1 Tax=Actimicrobium sp. CCI2.3 TaxID=3048616 RepID=UPI002AB5150D|nr:type IV pilus modification protein PilV [Actimicrobium sp. CCI2.3]MDY7576334.1 type IV pilus modification protein PilV [Actimicrobium sp. CCI2.3]